MAPAPESAPDSVAVKFDIKETVEAKEETNETEKEDNEGKNQNQSTGTAAVLCCSLVLWCIFSLRSSFEDFASLYSLWILYSSSLQDTSGQAS